ncbi:MAG: hypothetical protein J7M34_02140 [Anaerolineae bacterium]|nr:hypothetical protein [Anaerolineae bacterium]
MERDAFKVGIIGAIIGGILGLFSAVPLVGCVALPLALVLYVAIGVFAGLRVPPPRQAGPGAGAGAIAGVMAGLGYGLATMVVEPLVFTLMGGAQAAVRGLRSLPPQFLDMYRQAGLDPQMFFSLPMVTLSAGLCCLSSIVFAAILGAIGGAIAAAASR